MYADRSRCSTVCSGMQIKRGNKRAQHPRRSWQHEVKEGGNDRTTRIWWSILYVIIVERARKSSFFYLYGYYHFNFWAHQRCCCRPMERVSSRAGTAFVNPEQTIVTSFCLPALRLTGTPLRQRIYSPVSSGTLCKLILGEQKNVFFSIKHKLLLLKGLWGSGRVFGGAVRVWHQMESQ